LKAARAKRRIVYLSTGFIVPQWHCIFRVVVVIPVIFSIPFFTILAPIAINPAMPVTHALVPAAMASEESISAASFLKVIVVVRILAAAPARAVHDVVIGFRFWFFTHG
jgi:hypothetical protein